MFFIFFIFIEMLSIVLVLGFSYSLLGRVEYLKLLLKMSVACLLQLSILWDIVIVHCRKYPIPLLIFC